MKYEELHHIKADHALTIRFGSRGTQQARFERWVKRANGGTPFMLVSKFSAKRKRWIEHRIIECDAVISI